MGVVGKVNVEVLHQLEGPLTSSLGFEKTITTIEKVIDLGSLVAYIIAGNPYLTGVTLIDTTITFIEGAKSFFRDDSVNV